MAQTFTSLLYHCVFSTKDRQPQSVADIAAELHAYLGGIVGHLGRLALTIGGVADHVHLLASLPAVVSVAEAMRVVKANSSKWVHDRWPARRAFAWQNGYGAFTVSKSNVGSVIE